jgi:hypothetical protein
LNQVTTRPFTLGWVSGQPYFDGAVQGVSYLRNRPFTQQEMDDLYNAGAGVVPPGTAVTRHLAALFLEFCIGRQRRRWRS